jgi:hypothetical protein
LGDNFDPHLDDGECQKHQDNGKDKARIHGSVPGILAFGVIVPGLNPASQHSRDREKIVTQKPPRYRAETGLGVGWVWRAMRVLWLKQESVLF